MGAGEGNKKGEILDGPAEGEVPRRGAEVLGFKAAGVSHGQPENSKRADLRVPAFNHTTNIQRDDPQERKKE